MNDCFPKNLKALRKEKGLTQEQLATKINSSQNTIASYETRGKKPQAAMRKKLLEALNCTEADLFGYSDGYSNNKQALDKVNYFIDFETIGHFAFLENNELKIDEKSFSYIPKYIRKEIPEGYFYHMNDNSMNLTIPYNSNIYIKPTQIINHCDGHVCLVKHKNKLLLRRLRKTGNNVILEPESQNPKFKKIFIDLDMDNDFIAYGRAVYFTHDIKGL